MVRLPCKKIRNGIYRIKLIGQFFKFQFHFYFLLSAVARKIHLFAVNPVQAGIQTFLFQERLRDAVISNFWIPACAGMTADGTSGFPLSANYTHSNITPASFICNTVLLLSASSPSNSLSNAATLTGCFSSTASIKL